MFKLSQGGTIFHLIYFIVMFCLRYNEPFEKKAKFYILFGSITASLSLCSIFIKIKLAIANYTYIILVGTRCVVTLMLLKLSNDGAEGF